MRRKLIRILEICLEQLRRMFRRKPVHVQGRDVGNVVVPAPFPPCVQRIRRLLDMPDMRQRRGVSGVWQTRADSFADAYRVLLRFCSPKCIKVIRQAGHVRYKAVLPDGEGTVLLSDRVGNRRNAVAVMTFAVKRLPEVKEIRFCMSGKAEER